MNWNFAESVFSLELKKRVFRTFSSHLRLVPYNALFSGAQETNALGPMLSHDGCVVPFVRVRGEAACGYVKFVK